MIKFIDIKKASNEAKILIAKEIAGDLKEGKTLVFPTETVYGLACDFQNKEAVEKIYEIKGREKSKPLPVMIGNVEDIYEIARDIPNVFFELANKYMPGPLTVVLKKNKNVSDIITGGLDTVGVRMPNHLFAINLIKYLGGPMIATSANLSGKSSPKDFETAEKDLKEKADVFVDDGPCSEGVPSTIIDLSGNEIKIIRQGELDLSDFVNKL